MLFVMKDTIAIFHHGPVINNKFKVVATTGSMGQSNTLWSVDLNENPNHARSQRFSPKTPPTAKYLKFPPYSSS